MIVNNKYLDTIKITPILETLKLGKIEDEVYFSSQYSDYISNSRLGLINPYQNNDPKAFFEGKFGLFTESLIVGSAVHELILQNELFHLCKSVVRPSAKLGYMADELYPIMSDASATNEQKDKVLDAASNKIDYYKGKFDINKKKNLIEKCSDYWKSRKEYESNKLSSVPIYLCDKSRETVEQCVKAVEANKSIQALLHPEGLLREPISENEQAITVNLQVEVPGHSPFILKWKSKLDNYTIDFDNNALVVNDVKTTSAMLNEFDQAFTKYHYYRELYVYSWLLKLIAKKYYNMDNCTMSSNCLVVSTVPKYYTKVYKVSLQELHKGKIEFNYLMKLIAHYYSRGYRFK